MKRRSNILAFGRMRLLWVAAVFALLNPISTSGQQFPGNFADSPIVVELFTSQSCASCPPAETFVTNVLRNMESVVPLAMHVDYWNYLGWTDRHSDIAFTKRQQSYANAADMPFVFTPQIVIQGQYLIAGHAEDRIYEIINAIRSGSDEGQPIVLNAERVDDGYEVRLLNCSDVAGNYIVQRVMYYDQEIESVVHGGENEGRSWVYSNVVSNLLEVPWDGQTEFNIEENNLAVDGDTSVIVLLQEVIKKERYHGPIVSSLRLKNHSDEPFKHLRISYLDEYRSDCVDLAEAN